MYIKINNTKYPCADKRADEGGIVFDGVVGLDKPPTSGVIRWFADDGFELGAADVGAFKRQVLVDGTLTLTDTPAPVPPTEAELLALTRTAAQERVSGKCSEAICSGITVDGKHYSLSDRDQLSLNAAWAQVNGGAATVPYAADGEALTDYTAAQITAVGKAAYDWGIVCRTYYGLLYQWVQRETDRDKLAGIQYGSKLPDDLMQALAATLQGAGIDVSKYSGMFN